jgi:NAD(P)-dependent dehydrogenase (short-subunit alcohol dehydrogenase family)
MANGRFDGKVLLATGAGSGIGAAVAERFTAEGGRVALVDLDLERVQELAGRVQGAIALSVDVADEAGVRETVRRAHEHFGRIDCLFNGAGHADFGPLQEWSLERLNRMLGVHVGGTFLFCREVVPLMLTQGAGSVVNVASIAALVAQPDNAPYGAAKGAIAMFSRQLARDVGPAVRVNVVAPGRILTGMTRPLYTERGGGDLAKGVSAAAGLNMLERIGEASDIAGPVCFLFSDDAAFMTASVVVIDGGETAL